MPRRAREMTNEERQSSIYERDMEHNNHIHQTALVSRDEDSRRLRVRKQLLRDDAEALRDQSLRKDDRIRQLIVDIHEARAEAKAAKESQQSQQKLLTAQTRELSHLKTELESLSGVTQDSTKLLSEKLALDHEICTLKPELEHLRTQLAYQQNIVAQKLSLERQLNAAEVELAAEKRARQQTSDREDGLHVEDRALRRQMKELENKLATETRERQRLQAEVDPKHATHLESLNVAAEQAIRERLQECEKSLATEKHEKERVRHDGETAVAGAQAKIELLEQRLDGMKQKLRSTKALLQTCQAELAEARQSQHDVSEPMVHLPNAKVPAIKKRRAHEMRTGNASLSASDEDNPKHRKPSWNRGVEPSGVGEKSTFSITPFLSRSNKTTVSLDALDEVEEDEADTSHVPLHGRRAERDEASVEEEEPLASAVADASITSKANAKVRGFKVAGRSRGRPKKVLTEACPNLAPEIHPTGQKKTASSSSAIDSKPEAPANARLQRGTNSQVAATDIPDGKLLADNVNEDRTSTADNNACGGEPGFKKRRRRLIAGTSKTIFDEQDLDQASEANLKKPAKNKLGADATRSAAGIKHNAFSSAAFSPLKKHRRGVHASFLA